MKIIREGKLPELPEVEFECEYCGCIFIANSKDYTAYTIQTYTTEPFILGYFCDCPTCGRNIFAKYKKVKKWKKRI